MRFLFLILVLPLLGATNRFKDARLNEEFTRVYHEVRTKRPVFVSMTLADIQATTPVRAGEPFYCTNCTTDAVCVSTGTGRGAFSRLTARTTACQ